MNNMKQKYIVGNWKMTLNKKDSLKLAEDIRLIKQKDNVSIEIAPTYLYLQDIIEILNDTDVSVISQNFDYESLGSFTGGISLTQLKEIGLSKTILGHSERRSKFNESNEMVDKKLEIVLNSNFDVIYCFDSYEQIPFNLIKNNLNTNSKLTLAYEPIWAIGTGETATVEHIEEIHSKVSSTLKSLDIKDIPILYGGSVNPANSNQILHANNVDGVLVGGASTKFNLLKGIINSI
jgi:triosephosphate isomerase